MPRGGGGACHFGASGPGGGGDHNERSNDAARNTGRSGRQNAATRRSTRRAERVTVQGPAEKPQPDGMSHKGGRGGGWRCAFACVRLCFAGISELENSTPEHTMHQLQGSPHATGPSADHRSAAAPNYTGAPLCRAWPRGSAAFELGRRRREGTTPGGTTGGPTRGLGAWDGVVLSVLSSALAAASLWGPHPRAIFVLRSAVTHGYLWSRMPLPEPKLCRPPPVHTRNSPDCLRGGGVSIFFRPFAKGA